MATNRDSFKEVTGISVGKDQALGVSLELDPSTLDADFTYRWVHRSPRKVARYRAIGYVLVDPGEDEGVKLALGDSPETTEDGMYVMGDVVLMKCQKLNHKQHRQAVRRKSEQRLKGPTRQFKREAREQKTRSGERIQVITDEVDPQ